MTVSVQEIRTFLAEKIIQNSPSQKDWLEKKTTHITQNGTDRGFFLAFSGAPRFVGKELLILSDTDIQQAGALRSGWRMDLWQVDTATRVLFLLSLPQTDAASYSTYLSEVFDVAEMAEMEAIMKGFAVLPFPEAHTAMASEGVRTNMTLVFDGIALHNPFPGDYFDELAWNQMYLKSAFNGRPMYKIQDVEKRANAELARIISDYAHERWAAGRAVTPEIWRPVSGFMNETLLEDIQRLFSSTDVTENMAAALVCHQDNGHSATHLLNKYPALKKAVEAGQYSWLKIGKKKEMEL